MWIHLAGRPLFAIAGLWDEWKSPDGDAIKTCTIITTEANDAIKPVHNRMPGILSAEAESLWLDQSVSDPSTLISMLHPCPDNLIRMHAVSTRVNSSRSDLPEMIEEAGMAV